MKVNSKNIPFVIGMINKIIKKNPVLNTQRYYPTSKKLNSLKNLLGIGKNELFNNRSIEKSVIHSFEVKQIENREHTFFTKNYQYYININNDGVSIDGLYVEDVEQWKSTVIYENDIVVFKNNIITIKRYDVIDKRNILIKIWFTKK